MKKNGFTLLELLIGVALVSVVIVFLFRLINDIQHESLSNTYIVSNQVNRNEIISLVNEAIVHNGDICSLTSSGLNVNKTYTIGFCNYVELTFTVTKNNFIVNYNNREYSYRMKDELAYYDTNFSPVTFSYNNKTFIKFDIRTEKKGLKSSIIDDIEIIGTVNNLSTSESKTAMFRYTGDYQEFVVPETGTYKIEAWGAQGGGEINFPGGKGGYTAGNITLNANDVLYVYVGGMGKSEPSKSNAGGYNGGGYSGFNNNTQWFSYGGGGATDIRLVDGDWDNVVGLRSRIMVAGGGGGTINAAKYSVVPGAAGGLVGGTAAGTYESTAPTGGTQTAPGEGSSSSKKGAFGKAKQVIGSGFGGGGGGGWYGGALGSGFPGGGGSSFISGHTGCVAKIGPGSNNPIEGCTDGTQDIECSYHYSGKIFTSTVMKSGTEIMPSPIGSSNITGNEGNGYLKITYLNS